MIGRPERLRVGRHTVAVGDKFGQWEVICLPAPGTHKGGWKATVTCLCSCGREKDVWVSNLLRGLSHRCNPCAISLKKMIHGESYGDGVPGSPLYRKWAGMVARCRPTNAANFDRYCGRGIGVCEEWKQDYTVFRDWALENGFEEGLTLDRKDNNLGYFPANCRWATYTEQNRNRRDNVRVTAFGESKTVAEWGEDSRCVIGLKTLYSRIKSGWPPEVALTKPRRGRATA